METYNIKDKEFWEDFKSDKFAINCETIEEFKKLLTECEKQGLVWCTEKKVTEDIEKRWTPYEQNTCLDCSKPNYLQYSSARYFTNRDIKIIKFKDIISKTYNINEVMNFEIGTKVRCIDIGSVLLIKAGIGGEKMLWFQNLNEPCRLSSIYFEKKFELVEEWEEVNFMKAMEAYYKNNKIKCEYVSEFIFSCNGEQLIDLEDDGLLVNLILNGRWFIKK